MNTTTYHHESDIDENTLNELYAEVNCNSDLYAPLKTGFGQYPSVSHSREIIVIRSLTAEHDAKKNVQDLNFVGSGVWKPSSSRFPKTIQFVEHLAREYSALEVGKVMYARIPPRGTINFHTDSFPLYSGFIRAHIPVYSKNGGSDFYTENGNFTMTQGGLFFYDTKPMHTTKNNSDENRTHLIIDLLVPDRQLYFETPSFYYERIKTTDELLGKLNSAEFKEIQSKLGTLLLVVCVDKDTTFILWNSKGSRDYYLDQFALYSDVLECSDIGWRESYELVHKEVSGKTPIIIRKDYDFTCS